MSFRPVIYAVLACLLIITSCGAPSDEARLEEAKYALDSGAWNTAIAKSIAVLDEEPGNVRAALFCAAGYAGRAGIRLLDLLAAIATSTHRHDLFDSVHDSIGGMNIDTTDLRSSITTLTNRLQPQPEDGNAYYDDHQFKAGVLRALEAYIINVVVAQPTPADPIDVSKITDTMKDTVQEDLIEGDKNLINSGLSEDNDIIKSIRSTYCVLKNASTSASGFDTSALRDMVKCQLSPNNGEGLSKDGGDFESPNINTCDDLDYDACENAPAPS